MNKATEISEYVLKLEKDIEEQKKMFEMQKFQLDRLLKEAYQQASVDAAKVKPVKPSKRYLEIDCFSDSARKLPNKGNSTQFSLKKHWYELGIMMFYKFSEETKKVQPHSKPDTIGSCIFCGKEIIGQIVLIKNWKNHLQNCHQDIPEWKEYVKTTPKMKEQRRPPRKKKMSGTASTPVVESSPQDQALQQWEPVLVYDSTKEGKVVYFPRRMANPAVSSVMDHRRTFSSDSSADGIQNNKPKTLHPREGKLVSKLSAKCQEIHISCRDHLLCIKLCPRTSILRNSLNANILRELAMVLRKLKMETSIHVVLITSSGPDFCNGIDFPSLIYDNMAQRLESAMTIVSNLQEFITELANCDKILIGGLVGSVMGLGVAMLPYLNAVYACDKTSFCLPYVKLGQSYEGGLSLTLSLVSRNLDNLLFSEGRRLTATQAKDCGLIQDVFLPDNFEKEVVIRACKMAAEVTQSSLAGKRMSQASLRRDLPDVLKEESQLLRQTWISDDFQRRAKQFYANGDLLSSL